MELKGNKMNATMRTTTTASTMNDRSRRRMPTIIVPSMRRLLLLLMTGVSVKVSTGLHPGSIARNNVMKFPGIPILLKGNSNNPPHNSRREIIISRRYSSISSNANYYYQNQQRRRHTDLTNTKYSRSEEEQDNVDIYLEFLDKRYRRLHPRDVKKKKRLQQRQQYQKDQQQQQQQNKQSYYYYQPFSAMEWLLNGRSSSSNINNDRNNDSNTVTTTEEAESTRPHEEQEEDALYVLGVAGLASQKLLQRHGCYHTNKKKNKPTVKRYSYTWPGLLQNKEDEKKQQLEADDTGANAAAATVAAAVGLAAANNGLSDEMLEMINNLEIINKGNGLYQSFVRKVILPFLRLLYAVDRKKKLLKRVVRDRVANPTINAVRTRVVPTALNVLLGGWKFGGDDGGWKGNNVVRTVTYGYTVLIVFRYYFNAIYS